MKPETREKILNIAFDCGAVPTSVDPQTGKITAVGFMVEDVARMLYAARKAALTQAAGVLVGISNNPNNDETTKKVLRGIAANLSILEDPKNWGTK